MSKLYCYVDESGQHTQGDYFSVAAVIVNTIGLRDEGEHMLLEIEAKTGKRSTKWTRTFYLKKTQYLRAIATIEDLKGALFYSIHVNTRDYIGATVDTIARAVQQHMTGTDRYRLTVIVDD